MKRAKSLHRILGIAKEKITPLDYSVLFVVITVVAIFFIFFRRENKIIEIRFKLTDPDIGNMSMQALDEYASNFRVGDKEYNGLGQVINEIVSVDSYRTKPYGQIVYLNLRVKALYNPRKKQYSIQGKPVVAGQSFVFVFSQSKAIGIIVDFPNFISTRDMPHKKITVRVQLQDVQRAYSDIYGVPEFVAQAIKAGDTVTDSNGIILAKVLKVEILPAKRTVVTSSGASITYDPSLKDVFYTLDVNTFHYGGRYYLYDYVPISIGEPLPLNFPLINILPIVIDIK